MAGCGIRSTEPPGSPPQATSDPLDHEGYSVCAWYPDYDQKRAFASLQIGVSAMTEVNPVWYNLDADGRIQRLYGAEDPALVAVARQNGIRIVPVVLNCSGGRFDPAPVLHILGSFQRIRAHAESLAALVRAHGFDGIELDYELLPSEASAGFTQLVAETRRVLPEGAGLSLAVHPKTSAAQNWAGPGAQNWEELLPFVDRFKIMLYDYSWSTGSPGPIAPLNWSRQVLDYALSVAGSNHAGRVFMGIPVYGWDWSSLGPAKEAIFEDVQKLLSTKDITILESKRDESSNEPMLRYGKTGVEQITYYQDVQALQGRIHLIHNHFPQIGGVALWRLGGEDPSVWEALRLLRKSL
mgnify:CR=1 FL=1